MPTTEQVMALLKTRRSIRTFRDKLLAKEAIERIIDGARFAPSGNTRATARSLLRRWRDRQPPGQAAQLRDLGLRTVVVRHIAE